MHGDLLCTDDVAYQRFRRFARNPFWKQLFLWRSLAARRHQAAKYRIQSNAATANKSLEIMDVNQATVRQYIQRFKATQFIHGHTHRPGQYGIFIDTSTESDHIIGKRWVLGEWQDDNACILKANKNGIQFETIT